MAKVVLICGAAMLLLGTQGYCQRPSVPAHFTYFKTNIINDTNNLAAAEKAYRAGKITKEEMMLVTLATLNDEPIEFYGKLEDQFSNAVPNASIDINVTVDNGTESGIHKGKTVSNEKGLFKISGYHGESLGIMPHKEGYALASISTPSRYSHLEPNYFVPDSNSPVTIKMWKVHGAEPLISINKRYKLHYTNAPIYFDLLNETNVFLGGDIRVTVTRTPRIISNRSPQFWSVKFEAIDGGLIDSSGTERNTYFAPENGYQPTKFISSKDKLPERGTDGFHTGFYLKSRNGQVYAKLGVTFMINRNPDDFMDFEFRGVANTNYSRNWEGASGTFLKPGF